MVTLSFLSAIRSHAYRVFAALFAFVLTVVILSIAVSLISRFAERIKSLSKRKLRDALLDYTLSDAALTTLEFKRSQRPLAMELFSSIISSIKGRLQTRLKAAVAGLGFVDVIERDVQSALPSKRLRACHRHGGLE